MQRRQLLKQIGASSAIAFGAVGASSARSVDEVPQSEVNYIATEVDGEMREFTLEEFDQHPETRSLADIDCDCSYECKECCEACCYGELCCYSKSCESCSSC